MWVQRVSIIEHRLREVERGVAILLAGVLALRLLRLLELLNRGLTALGQRLLLGFMVFWVRALRFDYGHDFSQKRTIFLVVLCVVLPRGAVDIEVVLLRVGDRRLLRVRLVARCRQRDRVQGFTDGDGL